MTNRLSLLPDELYKYIYSYVFSPKVHIKRWDEKKRKYTNLFINKCVICNRRSHCVELIHICSCCNPYKRYFYGNKKYCENTLFCWFCLH
jgi:hypothetical protein